MKTRKLLPILTTLAVGVSFIDRAAAQYQASDSSSSAQDVTANLTVTGGLSVIGLTLADLNVPLLIGPLHSASGSAPGSYNNVQSLLDLDTPVGDGVSANLGLASINLDASVEALSVSAISDLATAGSNAVDTSGIAQVAGVGVGLEFDALLLGSSTLVGVDLDTNGAIVTANAATGLAGGIPQAAGGSNLLTLLSSGSTLTVTLLGAQIPITADAIIAGGGTVNVLDLPIPTVSLLGVTVSLTGSVTLSIDALNTDVTGGDALAEATSISLDVNLGITGSIPVVANIDLQVNGDISINSAQSALTAVPVPEPSGAVLLLAGSMLTAMRRRRAA